MSRTRTLLLFLLAVTAAYVFLWPAANVPYFAAVLLHLAAGVAFVVVLAFFLPAILRKASPEQRAAWILLAIGGALGIALIFTGTRKADWPLLWAHIGSCVAGGALLVSSWAGRRGVMARHGASQTVRAAVVLLGAALVVAGAWWIRTVSWERSDRIENPEIAPAAMNAEGDGPTGLFFPSSAQTKHGGHIPADYFIESNACERCHADIYKEWAGSAHHFSSFNNAWYRKSIEYMQDTVGIRPSKWCAGCHDPALLFSGMFDRPVREVEDTPAGQAGLGCMMCHSFVKVKSSMGQGDYELEYPVMHKLAASKNPYVRRLHDFLVELNPEPHRRVFLKPFMRTQTAEFCSSCHKVHLDIPVNQYRWIRGFNEYDNWQASGVSGLGARSFYYPPRPEQCADCHMPARYSTSIGNQGVFHSHEFPAANTALPYVNRDGEQLKTTEQFLTQRQLSVDIFSISPELASRPVGTGIQAAPEIQTTFAVGEEAETPTGNRNTGLEATPIPLLSAPLDRVQAAVRRGETYRVDVVVRTRGVGHFFPGGTVDAYDCWLELEGVDDQGRVIFWSGQVEDHGKGPVDPGAHFYKSLQIDGKGNPINKRNAWATRAVVYVHLIPPGAADTVHYRMYIPEEAAGHIHLDAKLNYRKFAWWTTQFSFAGVPAPDQHYPAVSPAFDDTRWAFTGDPAKVPGGKKGIPDLPIVVVAENKAELDVLAARAAEPGPRVVLEPSDWTRWNDYGIGLLLEGDLTGAAGAFEKITQIDPGNPDGWVNIGRVRVQEGNLGAARVVLERALAISPHLARAHFFYAKVLRGEGKYDQAAAELREVLGQYPRDRVVHDDLGRILFLQRKYGEAEKEFRSTLTIDPEDLEANYNLMLCATGMGERERASEFEKRYLRFKADESAQTLTGPYLREHPLDNIERQPIHEHVSDFQADRGRSKPRRVVRIPARGAAGDAGGRGTE
ncbi:MAG TPA: tetratricopeptide repeat protein [Candidatus Cybelea sp.]|nr:tetratricopeptide repeat protein [Candidatus Cybelea sp.]